VGLDADEGNGGDVLSVEGTQNFGERHGEEGLVVDGDGRRKDVGELAHGSSQARGVLSRDKERDGESGGSMDEFPGGRNAKTGVVVSVK